MLFRSICAAGLDCHQVSRLRGLLVMSTGAAVCTVLLILYPGATIEMVCYVIAIYSLLLSVGKFNLAKAWNGNKREQQIMYLLAALAFAFSACLVGFAGSDDRDSLAVLASYSLFMGFQMLLTMYFLERQMLKPSHRLHQASV